MSMEDFLARELRPLSEKGIRAHLMAKVEEWVSTTQPGEKYATLEDAEQDFKEWLWGNSNPTESNNKPPAG